MMANLFSFFQPKNTLQSVIIKIADGLESGEIIHNSENNAIYRKILKLMTENSVMFNNTEMLVLELLASGKSPRSISKMLQLDAKYIVHVIQGIRTKVAELKSENTQVIANSNRALEKLVESYLGR